MLGWRRMAWIQTWVDVMARKAARSAVELKRLRPLYPGGPTAAQLRTEVEKQRRVPGIIFANGPTGRRARIAGTGIEVFEVIGTYHAVGEDRTNLAERYDWLTPEQLNAALAYYTAFPDEIDQRLAEEEALERHYRAAHSAP